MKKFIIYQQGERAELLVFDGRRSHLGMLEHICRQQLFAVKAIGSYDERTGTLIGYDCSGEHSLSLNAADTPGLHVPAAFRAHPILKRKGLVFKKVPLREKE